MSKKSNSSSIIRNLLNQETFYYNFTKLLMKNKQEPEQESEIEEGQQVSEHSQSSEFIKIKYAGRKNLCEICNNVLSKYTCPKCDLKTCSLTCTRKHKEVKQCTGQKDPTQYVSMGQIDQKIVEKDYNFIEGMISGTDKVKKVLSGVNNTINLEPRRFKILRNNARQLYGIKLSNGPNILERHRENISFFFVKTKSIYWIFQLFYFEGKQISKNSPIIKTSQVITQPISDQKTFLEVLPQNYLNKNLLETKNINTTKRQQFCVFLQNKQRLQENFSQGQNQNKRHKNAVISQKIVSGKFVTHFELIQYELAGKINEQMVDIAIFQFPTLYVVHASLRQEFIKTYKEVKLQKSKIDYRQESYGKQRNTDRQRSRQKQLRDGRLKPTKKGQQAQP